LRRYRAQYIEAGALLELAGRFVVDPLRFEATLRHVGRQIAAEAKPEETAT
jgi:hypothetical protein